MIQNINKRDFMRKLDLIKIQKKLKMCNKNKKQELKKFVFHYIFTPTKIKLLVQNIKY